MQSSCSIHFPKHISQTMSDSHPHLLQICGLALIKLNKSEGIKYKPFCHVGIMVVCFNLCILNERNWLNFCLQEFSYRICNTDCCVAS